MQGSQDLACGRRRTACGSRTTKLRESRGKREGRMREDRVGKALSTIFCYFIFPLFFISLSRVLYSPLQGQVDLPPVDVIFGKREGPGRRRSGDVAEDIERPFFQRLGKNGQGSLDLIPDERHKAVVRKWGQGKMFRFLQQEQPGERRMGRRVHVQAPWRSPNVESFAPAPGTGKSSRSCALLPSSRCTRTSPCTAGKPKSPR